MQRMTKEASGIFLHWPLADALAWRMQWKCSPTDAFNELAKLCREGRVYSIGIYVESHPERPTGWDFPTYRPFIDPPASIPIGTPGLGMIPADHWLDFCPVLDPDQRPTSGLDYASIRLRAWRKVEFERNRLVMAWKPMIAPKRKPGPKPAMTTEIVNKMLDDLVRGKCTPEQLEDIKLVALAAKYGGANNTADKARDIACRKFSELPGRDSEKR
jgi:hypothetical protein